MIKSVNSILRTIEEATNKALLEKKIDVTN